MPSYTPPVEDLTPPIPADPREWQRNKLGTRLRRFYSSNPQGVNVYRLTSGAYTRQQPVLQDDIDRVFYGGHLEPVTAAEQTAIQAAGVGGTFTTFDPRTSPGLVWWVAADQLGLTNGATVSSWPSLVEETHIPPLVQATAGRRPVFTSNVLNGLPVVRFDGVDDFLRSASWPMEINVPFTVLAVWSIPATSLNVPMAGGFRGFGYSVQRQADGTVRWVFRTTNNISKTVFRNTVSTSTTATVRTVTLDDDLVLTLAQNGTVDQGAAGSTGSPLALTPPRPIGFTNRMTLGGFAVDDVASNFSAVDIAELCLWNRVLSAAELAFHVTDARSKYGL